MRHKTHFGFRRSTPASCILLFVNLALFLNACKIDPGSTKIAFGKEGNIKGIIIPGNSGPVIKFAAAELQGYLGEITGDRLPIVGPGAINENKKAIRFSLEGGDGLNWDGFSITTGNIGVTITAKEPRGLLYGAYQLLEEAGCSFVYLGKKEEIVPRMETVGFLPGERVFNPVIEHRGLTPYGLQASSVELGRDFIDWMAKNKLNYILVSEDRPSDSPGSVHGSIWKEVNNELLPELQKRGFVIEMSEHCTPVFFPRSLFNEHPDWFALNDGERKLGEPPYSGQMCYSNHDAVEYYATAIADYAAKHPEFHVIGTWPLDGGEYCECEACKDPQTVFNAAKRVAEKVKKARPDMIVEHLAYKAMTWQPPTSEKIPDNMSVLWCPDNGKMSELAKEWVQKSARAGGIYQFEYYMGDNYRSRANVWLRPGHAVSSVRYAQEIGYRGVVSLFLPMENWWRSCFNYWFFAKACWDPGLEINACIHAYCQNYYGSYAGEIEKIFMGMFTGLHPEPFLSVSNEAYTDRSETIKPVAAKIIGQLDMIIGGCEEPVIIERLIRLKTYVDFFRLYYEAFSIGGKESLERLTNYSKERPGQDMVLMYPEYIKWRNSDLLR